MGNEWFNLMIYKTIRYCCGNIIIELMNVNNVMFTQLRDSNWSVENALEVFFEKNSLESLSQTERPNQFTQDMKGQKDQMLTKSVDSNLANANQPPPQPKTQAVSQSHLNDLLIFAVIQKKPRSDLAKLIQRGADVNSLCPRTNRTPLAYAVNENNHRTVIDLIDLGADVNLEMPDGHTALRMAILNPTHDGTEMARLLLSKGANHAGVREAVGPAKISVTVQYWLDQVPTPPAPRVALLAANAF
jgi:hypothetical protein